jgi:LacI family transcriptional regulator
MARLMSDFDDLIGVYNVGAGLPGVAKAIIDAGREQQLTLIGHDLTPASRRFLLRGVADAIVAQDPGHEARSAIRVLLALSRSEPILVEQERIRIEIVMRDNLP